jgi:hypothetical protein
MRSVPRADVEDERRHAHHHREEDEGEDHRLSLLIHLFHSTRSVVVLVNVPDFENRPSRLIE